MTGTDVLDREEDASEVHIYQAPEIVPLSLDDGLHEDDARDVGEYVDPAVLGVD